MREHELRQLKKQTADFEEQNAVLSKHIDSIKSAIGKKKKQIILLLPPEIFNLYLPMFRIRVHLIRIRIQHFRLIIDPDPWF
jgi:hypothetical protein